MTTVIPFADIDREPVILTYRRAEPVAAPLPDFASEPEVREQQLPMLAQPAVEPADPQRALAELREQAFDEGYREGCAAAGAEARRELSAEHEALAKARAGLDEEHEGLLRLMGAVRGALESGIDGAEDVIVEIAYAAACSVLGEAAVTEEGVRGMVREATREIRSREKATVRISHADYERLAAEPARLQRLAEELKVELAADERVALGGCLIEAAGGTLDARLEVQLRQLADTLVKVRAAGSSEMGD